MAQITNINNYPAALVKAIQNDPYNKGDCDFSVTGLLKPARQAALQEKHKDQITEDAEDGLYRLYGQIAHSIIERANENDISEVRYFAKFAGYTVSGQVDTLTITDGILSDYKFTTAWGFMMNRPAKPEWVAQLNMQLELLRQNGKDANKLQIVGLLRDFNIRDAKDNPDYPRKPIAIMPIEIWPREKTQSFIETRIAEHVAARVSLPQCSGDDMWAKPDQWAVMNGKRAINGGIKESENEALRLQAANPKTTIQYRPGRRTRCEDYCSVNQFCEQYKEYLKLKGNK